MFCSVGLYHAIPCFIKSNHAMPCHAMTFQERQDQTRPETRLPTSPCYNQEIRKIHTYTIHYSQITNPEPASCLNISQTRDSIHIHSALLLMSDVSQIRYSRDRFFYLFYFLLFYFTLSYRIVF